MPQFPIRTGPVQLPADAQAQLAGVIVTNNTNGAASLTVTEVDTGRVVFQAAFTAKGQTVTLSGLNLTDLTPGGTYQVDAAGNLAGTITTH